MTLNEIIADRLRSLIDRGALTSAVGLGHCLRVLAIWRAKLIEQEIVARHGPTVQNGPFAGMTFRGQSAEGCLAPKLLGCYEAPLHPFLMEVAGATYETIIDIGAAEGYYAVGLARRAPGAHVHAYDTNPVAREAVQELAVLNGVADRVTVGGTFRGEDFAAFAGRRTLVVVDIEGAEEALLRPDLHPALAGMTLLVECHDVFKAGLCEELAARFRPTHAVRRVEEALMPPALPDWFAQTNHLDRLLAMWEWRSGPTPWLIMRPRA